MPRSASLAFCVGTLLSCLAHAQCPNTTWTGHFGTPAMGLANGTSTASAYAFQVFDPDGLGPIPEELYVAGSFQSAGGIATKGIARWNGQRWADVGGGVTNGTSAFVACGGLGLHDPDGPGPQLPVLILAGGFTAAGGVPASGIAAWNGSAWSPLGAGIEVESFADNFAIVDFDVDGPGPLTPRLMVGGNFLLPGPVFPRLAQWDGAQWQAVTGAPLPLALAVFDEDGPGPVNPALFAGVDLPPGLYKWDGTTWSEVGGGIRSAAHTCASLRVIDDDGIGPHLPSLFVGGFFFLAGPLPVAVANIARWDGLEWHPVGSGISGGQIESILAVPNPVGPPAIYAGDGFTGDVYQWSSEAQTWPRIGNGNGGFGVTVLACLTSFDDDQGGPNPPSIYFAAPGITQINNTPSRGIARYGCVPCYANCDGSIVSPSLNVNDFVCFMNRFAAGDSYANCDSSTTPPAMNVNDFVCFNNRFAAGCP